MKYLLACLLTFFPMSAFAMDCTSQAAINQAENAFGQGDPTSVALTHVSEGTLGAMDVCVGFLNSQQIIWINNSDGSVDQLQEDDNGNITTTNIAPDSYQKLMALGQALDQQSDTKQAAIKRENQQNLNIMVRQYNDAYAACKQTNPIAGILSALGNSTPPACQNAKQLQQKIEDFADANHLDMPELGQ
jgi:hypothetical protein